MAQTQTSNNDPPLHTALRLLYFFRNSHPNAEIYLPNLFQWEEGNPFFLAHWDKKIKLARKKLYKNNSTVLEGFITKAKWEKTPTKWPKPKQTPTKPLFQIKSWQQPVRSVMLPYKVQSPHTQSTQPTLHSLHWALSSPMIFFPSQWAEDNQVSCLLVQNWIALY